MLVDSKEQDSVNLDISNRHNHHCHHSDDDDDDDDDDGDDDDDNDDDDSDDDDDDNDDDGDDDDADRGHGEWVFNSELHRRRHCSVHIFYDQSDVAFVIVIVYYDQFQHLYCRESSGVAWSI